MDNALCLLSDVCRLCLDLPGIHNVGDLIQDLLRHIGIKISLDDGLPQNICSRCYYRIEAIKDLKECATKNDRYMNALLGNSSNIRHQVSLPKSSAKIMTDIVGDDQDKVNSYLKLEKQILKNSTANNNQTKKMREQTISVRPLNQLIKSPERTPECNNDDTKNEKRKSSTNPPSRMIIKKEKRRSTSDDYHVIMDGEFACLVCGKTYSTAKKLYFHQRHHSKNLFCPLDACGKSFVTKGDLQKHIRSHTGEKPYSCDLCDKRFSQNVTLKSHRIAVHGGV